MAGTVEGQGLVARVTTALRYALTGTSPQGWFGPLNPPAPQAPEEVRGRGWDYPVGANLNFRPRATEPLTFDVLKRLATHPIVAMLIQRQKDLVASQDWQIKPRLANEDDKIDDPAVRQITDFLRFPDQEHDWCQWIGAVLDQMLVIDAVTIYGAPTRMGGIYALQLLDGATIKPVLNIAGRRPVAPDPAYQQILKGLPAIDYTDAELIYFPQVYRVDRVYGYSRVEQAVDLINMAISRLRSQQGYFDFGTLGDGYFSAPDGWTPDQIVSLETRWNSYMQGDPKVRRAPQFVPHGTEWHETKTDILADEFDEFIVRLLCFPFGVAPTPFMKQMGLGKGSADTDHEAAQEGGIAPLLQYVERLMSLIIAKWFRRPDLEFSFVDNREFDPETAARIDDMNLKNGSRTINEVRDRRGEKPLPDGDVPMMFGSGWMRLEDAVKEPEPVPTALSGAPGQPGAREGQTPPAKPEEGEGDDAEDELSKAADPAKVHQLSIALATYLAGKGDAIAQAVADAMFKAAPMDDYSGRIESALDGVDWHWDDLPSVVEPMLAGIAAAAGESALSTLGLFDAAMLERVTARAAAYAEARGAEMVGMKLIDGALVPNPNPVWSIPETTRNMLRGVIHAAMVEGQSNQQLAKTIRESAPFSKRRASMVARTETAMADVQGSIGGWKESGVVEGKKFLAAPDCCDACQQRDGKIVPLDAEFDGGDPPLHPNCLPGDSLVSAAGTIAAVSKRWYDGDLVVIRTASGKQLSCTPNHPVLTPAGWVAAGLLNEGGHVVSRCVRDGESALRGYHEDVPTLIEDIAETFSRSQQVTAVPVPVSPEHFHGDGEGSEVAIVWADRLLVDRTDAARCKHCGKLLLPFGDMESASHYGASALDPFVEAVNAIAGGFMGSRGAGLALLGRHCSGAEAIGLGNSTSIDPILQENTGDRSPGRADCLGYSTLREAVGIELDDIVGVTRIKFSGHVYNLHTEHGFYVADGIVTHNCRCDVVAVLPEDMPGA